MERLWVASIVIVVAVLTYFFAIRRRGSDSAPTVTPDKIDPTYAGTDVFPASRMTAEEFSGHKFRSKSVGAGGMRLVSTDDGKVGVVEIAESNGVPFELQRPSHVGMMDAATAVQKIREKNSPEWTVTDGGSVDNDTMYVGMKRSDSPGQKVVLFRPVVVKENKAFKRPEAS
eukprot:jgi/Mesvir1/14671/Mv05337-RA.1